MPAYVIPPAGVSAASFFTTTPFVDPARPPAILADDIDPKTGELRSLFTSVHPVDAAIQYQFRVKRGSGACVLEQGQAFDSIKKNTSSAPNDLRFEAQRILQPFVDRGDAEIVTLEVAGGEAEKDRGAVFVQYRNLRTGKVSPIELPS
jgi:hypothetical protein